MNPQDHEKLNSEFLQRYPEFETEFSRFIEKENKISGLQDDWDFEEEEFEKILEKMGFSLFEWKGLEVEEKWQAQENQIQKLEEEFLEIVRKKILPKIKKRFEKMSPEELLEEKNYLKERNKLSGWLFWQPVMLFLLDLIWEAYVSAERKQKARQAGLATAKKHPEHLKKWAKKAAEKRWKKNRN